MWSSLPVGLLGQATIRICHLNISIFSAAVVRFSDARKRGSTPCKGGFLTPLRSPFFFFYIGVSPSIVAHSETKPSRCGDIGGQKKSELISTEIPDFLFSDMPLHHLLKLNETQTLIKFDVHFGFSEFRFRVPRGCILTWYLWPHLVAT